MLDLLATLERWGLSRARVMKLFFNTQTKVSRVEEDDELGLPFTSDETNRSTIREISNEYEKMSRSLKYKAILPPDAILRDKPMLSKDVASDLAPLFRDLDNLAFRQPRI